jgi:hypothetical protein
MSVLLCRLGIASKDVCLYVLAPMIDRVSMAMLAEAFGIEPICCEAFYREAGRLQHWNICARTQGYGLDDERFACGEGAAIGGFVEKIVDYVDKRQFGQLFDRVDMLAPVHVWNYLKLNCHDCLGIRARFRRRVESGKALIGINIDDNALPYLSDYTDMAMVAVGAGNGCDFMQWAIDRGDPEIKLACFRGIIRADNPALWSTLLAHMQNERLQYWHDVARDKLGPNLKAHLLSMGVDI